MQREDTLDTYAEADLTHSDRFANAAVLACDADALKGLQTFLVAFLNTDVYAERVARLEIRCVLFYLCLFDKIQSIHFYPSARGQRNLPLTFTICVNY